MEITDEYMQEQLATARVYSLVLLRAGDNPAPADRQALVWEHGRRNFALKDLGVMPIVGPVPDDSDIAGACILAAAPEEAAQIMDDDPAVAAGVFRYDVHPLKSFPGSKLP